MQFLVFFVLTVSSVSLSAIDLFDAKILERVGDKYRYGYEIEIQKEHVSKVLGKIGWKKGVDYPDVLTQLSYGGDEALLFDDLSIFEKPGSHPKRTVDQRMLKYARSKMKSLSDLSPASIPRIFHHRNKLFEYIGADELEREFFKQIRTTYDSTAYREYLMSDDVVLRKPREFLNLVEGGFQFLDVQDELTKVNQQERRASYHHHISREEPIPLARARALHEYKLVKVIEQHGLAKLKSIGRHIQLLIGGLDYPSFGTNLRENDKRLEEKLHIFPPEQQLIFTLNVLEYEDGEALLKKLYNDILNSKGLPQLLDFVISYHITTIDRRDPWFMSRDRGRIYGVDLILRILKHTDKPSFLAQSLLDSLSRLDSEGLWVEERFIRRLFEASSSKEAVAFSSLILEGILDARLVQISGEVLPYAYKEMGLVDLGVLEKLAKTEAAKGRLAQLEEQVYSAKAVSKQRKKEIDKTFSNVRNLDIENREAGRCSGSF